MNMEPINIKFNFNDTLEKIDDILKSGDIVVWRDSYNLLDSKGSKGLLMNASVIGVKFMAENSMESNEDDWAKVYLILVSQVYSLVASQPLLLDVKWDGYRLYAIFNTTLKEHVDSVLDTVGKIISLTDVINYKIKETGWQFKVIAAIDYKKIMTVSIDGENSQWLIDGQSKLDQILDDDDLKRLRITDFIFKNLKEGYRALFERNTPFFNDIYHADIVNIGMNNWLKQAKSGRL